MTLGGMLDAVQPARDGETPSGFHIRQTARRLITVEEMQMAEAAAANVIGCAIVASGVYGVSPIGDPNYRGHFSAEELTRIAAEMSDPNLNPSTGNQSV